MLSKKNRVLKDDFSLLFKKGRRLNSKIAQIVYFKNKNFNKSKFAFIVSSKEIKKSFLRNKLKRRARYVIKECLKNIKIPCFAAFVFNKNVLRADFLELKKGILNLLVKSEII